VARWLILHNWTKLYLSYWKRLGTDRVENTTHCNSIVSVWTCLLAKLLLSNGCFIFAYSANVAQQLAYMLHWSLLESARPEPLPIRCQSVQVYQYHTTFPIGESISSESGQCSYISGSYSVCILFFRFGEGRLIHNVQSHSATRWKSQLLASALPTRGFVRGSHIMFSRFPDVDSVSYFVLLCHCRLPSPSSDVADGLHLCPLCHCFIPVASDFSSWT
jgi:hypothetical protein